LIHCLEKEAALEGPVSLEISRIGQEIVDPAPHVSTRSRGKILAASFSDNFHENPLPPITVEFSIEDLFPGAEVEFAVGDRDDDFAAHYLAFEVGIGVVFAGAVVVILRSGSVRGEFFQPDFIIVVKTAFVVVDENGRSNVHRVAETKPLVHAASENQLCNGVGDIDKAAASFDFEPEVFGEGFHYAYFNPKVVCLKTENNRTCSLKDLTEFAPMAKFKKVMDFRMVH